MLFGICVVPPSAFLKGEAEEQKAGTNRRESMIRCSTGVEAARENSP
jgi:hypothetical protein